MVPASKPRPYTVIYDPDAVVEFVMAVKSKEERRALVNAVDKLREVGERLAPPHMKQLRCTRCAGASTGWAVCRATS